MLPPRAKKKSGFDTILHVQTIRPTDYSASGKPTASLLIFQSLSSASSSYAYRAQPGPPTISSSVARSASPTRPCLQDSARLRPRPVWPHPALQTFLDWKNLQDLPSAIRLPRWCSASVQWKKLPRDEGSVHGGLVLHSAARCCLLSKRSQSWTGHNPATCGRVLC